MREILVGRIRKGSTAAAPDRARGHSSASAPRSLLAPRLARRVLDRCSVFLRARALPRVGLVRDNNLMHQRLVVLATENGFGRRRRSGVLALGIEHFQFHMLSLISRSLASWRARAWLLPQAAPPHRRRPRPALHPESATVAARCRCVPRPDSASCAVYRQGDLPYACLA